jgi:hypothetical protein
MRQHLRALLALVLIATAPPVLAADQDSPRRARSGVEFQRNHSYSRDEARERLQLFLDYLYRAHGIQRAWQGDTARVQGRVWGVSFEAKVHVLDDRVEGQASDPGFLLRRVAVEYVNAKLRKYLHPSFEES